MARGDRLWADSSYDKALAEYRLSEGQHGDQAPVLLRIAHAYIKTGQFERAREYYNRLLQHSPEYTDQAVFDYLRIAHEADARSDRYGMAAAVEAASNLRPGLPVDDMAPSLARYYASTGDPDRALEYFERALATAAEDSVPGLVFGLAEVYEAQGNCEEAIGRFNSYLDRLPDGEHADEAKWHLGNCAFLVAKKAQLAGDDEKALENLQIIIDLGVPRNLLDQAWFERGEVLLAEERPEEALQAYLMVLRLSNRNSQLTERAQRRIDDIRFGRIRGDGP